jgi:hypothetical protein
MKFPEWVTAWFTRKNQDVTAATKEDELRSKYLAAVPHVCDKRFWVLQPGRDSNMTAEARYGCPVCDEGEFRGGWGSSLWLDPK